MKIINSIMKIIYSILKIIAWIWLIFCVASTLMFLSSVAEGEGYIVIITSLSMLPSIICLCLMHKKEKPVRDKKRIGRDKKRIEYENKIIEKEQIEEIKKTSFITDESGRLIFSFRREFGGSPCTVIIDGNWLIIERKGLVNAYAHGLDGKKKMNIKNITAVQFKEGGITSGYIQFVLLGSHESKGGVREANFDENSVTFGSDYNEAARKLVEVVEDKIDKLQNASNTITQVVQKESVAKQLKDLKELLDSEILTEEEFEKQKKKVLNS